MSIRELIDTLWNVNSGSNSKADKVIARINRYIMECKYEWQSRRGDSCRELIDTLWNVNLNSATAIVTPAAN